MTLARLVRHPLAGPPIWASLLVGAAIASAILTAAMVGEILLRMAARRARKR